MICGFVLLMSAMFSAVTLKQQHLQLDNAFNPHWPMNSSGDYALEVGQHDTALDMWNNVEDVPEDDYDDDELDGDHLFFTTCFRCSKLNAIRCCRAKRKCCPARRTPMCFLLAAGRCGRPCYHGRSCPPFQICCRSITFACCKKIKL